jgi:hypothetical protein
MNVRHYPHALQPADSRFTYDTMTPESHHQACPLVTLIFTQEFFSARDEPDPDIMQVQGEPARSPHPK